MAVPKRRNSSTSRNMRRSHHAVKALRLTTCPNCKETIRSHMACPTCGMYRGRQVIDVSKKLAKLERKRKERARDNNQ